MKDSLINAIMAAGTVVAGGTDAEFVKYHFDDGSEVHIDKASRQPYFFDKGGVNIYVMEMVGGMADFNF